MSIDSMDDYTVNLADAYAKDAYQKGYEQGKKDAVKHGSWRSCGHGVVKCSCCGKRFYGVYDDDRFDNYCRNCGAKMDAKPGGDYLDGEKPAKG